MEVKILKRFKFFAKWRENRQAKEESLENLNLDQSYRGVAFLGLGERLRKIFNLKKLSLNLQIYFRVTIVFFKKLPFVIFQSLRDFPKNFKKEGSKIKLNKTRFELANIWPHLGIAVLACAVISSSVFAEGSNSHNIKYEGENIEPVEYSDLAVSVDRYTPFITEKENDTIIQLAQAETVTASDESYILAPAELTTEKSPKVSTEPSSRTTYIAYEVLGGETMTHIGAKFNVSSLSVLWANPSIKNADLLQPGSSLWIPPRDGITVVVEKGQSFDGLVKKYSGDFNETLAANAITDPSTVFAGQRILIAEGRPPKVASPSPKIAGKVKGAKSSPTGPVGARGNFIFPTSGSICNTRHRGYYAVDICAGGASPPIKASDGGVVVSASYGWNSGWGNNVLIDHGNGFKTRYAHMRVLNVSAGQRVSQGQQVGIMGTTGNSTGIHLHFEVYIGPVRVNPLAYLR